jgi:hypothetical protein
MVPWRSASSESVPMRPTIPKGVPGRRFQLWEYHVSHSMLFSHSMLLIRCPKFEPTQSNVDVKFWSVEYIDLPSVLLDLEIDEPTQEDISFVNSRLGKTVKEDNIIVLKSGDRRHVVVAGRVEISESSMDFFESPFVLPSASPKSER